MTNRRRCCVISPSRYSQDSVLRWLGRPAAERQPLSICCFVSMTPMRGASLLTAMIPVSLHARVCVLPLVWCCRTPGFLREPYGTILPMVSRTPRMPKYKKPRVVLMRIALSSSYRRDMTRFSRRDRQPVSGSAAVALHCTRYALRSPHSPFG